MSVSYYVSKYSRAPKEPALGKFSYIFSPFFSFVHTGDSTNRSIGIRRLMVTQKLATYLEMTFSYENYSQMVSFANQRDRNQNIS